MAWVISIVTLAGATLMPLIGKISDKVGKKRVIMALACVFVLGSLISAIAPSFELMLVGRAAQGALVGIVALSYSLVRDVMPRDFVPIALGVVATGIGMSLSPVRSSRDGSSTASVSVRCSGSWRSTWSR